MKNLAFLLIFFCLANSFALSAADPFRDQLIQEIQKRHEEAIQGDSEAVINLISDLEKWTKEQPQNYLLQAYLGSAYTLRSRDLFYGPQKYSYLKNGIKLMDQAVDAAQDNPAVRFVRAMNNFNLPFFCNRKEIARNDFKILLNQISTRSNSELDKETMQAIYYYAGLSFSQIHQEDQARITWLRGLQLNPATPLADKISSALLKSKI